MANNFFDGQIVRLRAVRESDWEFFYTMDADTETARSAYQIPFPRSEESSRQWAKQESLKTPEQDAFRFVIESILDGIPVGTINPHDCDLHNRTFSYGIAIHAPFRGQGFASEAILLVLRYYFMERGYRKCTTTAYSFNQPSISLHQKLGFIHEGTLRQMEFSNGEFHDHVVFGITRDEFLALYGDRFRIKL